MGWGRGGHQRCLIPFPPALTTVRVARRRSHTRWKTDLHVTEKILSIQIRERGSTKSVSESQLAGGIQRFSPLSQSSVTPHPQSLCSVTPASGPAGAIHKPGCHWPVLLAPVLLPVLWVLVSLQLADSCPSTVSLTQK